MLPRTFLWTLRTCSRYLEDLLSMSLCVSEKNRDDTAHQ
eukprot:UN06889